MAAGSGFAFLGVALGAFGTHALRERISAESLQIWQTGVQYQLVHSLALVLVGIVAGQIDSKWIRLSGWLFFYGILIFSCSLYILALSGIRWFGAITPLGGLCFLAAWAMLAWAAARPKKSA